MKFVLILSLAVASHAWPKNGEKVNGCCKCPENDEKCYHAVSACNWANLKCCGTASNSGGIYYCKNENGPAPAPVTAVDVHGAGDEARTSGAAGVSDGELSGMQSASSQYQLEQTYTLCAKSIASSDACKTAALEISDNEPYKYSFVSTRNSRNMPPGCSVKTSSVNSDDNRKNQMYFNSYAGTDTTKWLSNSASKQYLLICDPNGVDNRVWNAETNKYSNVKNPVTEKKATQGLNRMRSKKPTEKAIEELASAALTGGTSETDASTKFDADYGEEAAAEILDQIATLVANPTAAIAAGEFSFIYRYILRESCSQFDSLPLTSLTIAGRIRRPVRQRRRGDGLHGCDGEDGSGGHGERLCGVHRQRRGAH